MIPLCVERRLRGACSSIFQQQLFLVCVVVACLVFVTRVRRLRPEFVANVRMRNRLFGLVEETLNSSRLPGFLRVTSTK
jgi:hypothetical protein